MFTVIAALRAGGVGSCWGLSTNSMSNHHLIPPHVCLLLPVGNWNAQLPSYWILLCQTSHSLFFKKASAKACFLDLFPCWSFPLHLVLVAEPSAWTWWDLCVVQQHRYPKRPSPCLVRTVLSEGPVLSDNVLIYWTVCSLGFITVFQLTLPSRLISGKRSHWSLNSTVFKYLLLELHEMFGSRNSGKRVKPIWIVRYSSQGFSTRGSGPNRGLSKLPRGLKMI